MKLEIEKVQPADVRQQVVDLLWEHRHWPGESREDYDRLWEWRYTALADGEPVAWVVRAPSQASVIAHVAVFPRRFRMGDRELLGGVPADLLIHQDWRKKVLSPRLIQQPISLAEQGVVDFLLTFATPVAHRILKLRGFREIGAFQDLVDVRRSASIFRRKSPVLAPLAPLADLVLAARRRWRIRGHDAAHTLRLEPIDREQLATLDRSHWVAAPTRLVGHDTVDFIERRFYGTWEYRLVALRDPSTDRVEAYAVLAQRNGRTVVADCQTNGAVLDVATALLRVGADLPGDTHAYVVSTVGDSDLARDLLSRGFYSRADLANVPFRVAAWWRPDHDLSDEFAKLHRWVVFPATAEF